MSDTPDDSFTKHMLCAQVKGPGRVTLWDDMMSVVSEAIDLPELLLCRSAVTWPALICCAHPWRCIQSRIVFCIAEPGDEDWQHPQTARVLVAVS